MKSSVRGPLLLVEMTFQFQCPQGHILEAESAHEGRFCLCPHCGARMEIPPAPIDDAPLIKVEGKESEYQAARWQADTPVIESPFSANQVPDCYHIPCPNGHELEALPEMLGKYAMCPHCEAKFKLMHENSVEFQQQQLQREETRQAQLARNSLNWAIVATVLTLLGLALLFLLLG